MITIRIPKWLEEYQLKAAYPEMADRIDLVLDLAHQNIKERSGGPFAAAVIQRNSGKPLALGVNLVISSHCSSAHAEVVALSLAQQKLQSYDLGTSDLVEYELVTSWQPCAMCLGAIHWSGIRSIAIAGCGQEIEELTGFDEGPIHPEWEKQLNQRGISVAKDLAHQQACEVFRSYRSSGGIIYNPRRNGN
ncbi:MAG: nucleoside deaminase [Bdellovibrionales bacterium]|nr:nucleoside deaminase [Bdellovibrionales bacterium]